MKTKNNYIIRFDSKELAKDCLQFFPIKSTFSDGFTITISGASNTEWEIYLQLVKLLQQKKINITVNRY